MNKIVFFICMVFITASCVKSNYVSPKGNITTELREIDNFNKIVVSTGVNLVLTQGNRSMQIQTYENIHEYVKTEVNDSVLTIKPDEYVFFKDDPLINVYLSAELIESITVMNTSAVNVTDNSVLTADNLTLNISGGSVLTCAPVCNELKINLGGGGKLTTETICKKLVMTVSEGATLKLSGIADSCSLSIPKGKIDAKDFSVANNFIISISGEESVYDCPEISADTIHLTLSGKFLFNSDLKSNLLLLSLSNESSIDSSIIKTDTLSLRLSTKSLLNADVEVNKLYANISGKSNVKGTGTIQGKFSTVMSDSSQIAGAYRAGMLQTSMSGGSQINYINVRDSIKGTVRSGSMLYYKGNPDTSAVVISDENSRVIKLE